MKRDEEMLRMMAASAGAEAPAEVPAKAGNGRKQVSFDADAAQQEAPAPLSEPALSQYPDIPSQVVTGRTSPAKRAIDIGIAGLMIGIFWPLAIITVGIYLFYTALRPKAA